MHKRDQKEKKELPFYKTIAMKLILGFLVPVAGIVILGLVSYNKSSYAIVSKYKESVEQTINMMQQCIGLAVSSEEDEFKRYLTDTEMQKYISGMYTDSEEKSQKKKVTDEVNTKTVVDEKVSGIVFLAEGGKSISDNTNPVNSAGYSEYVETQQGQKMAADSTDWLIFGQDKEADEVLGLDSSTYSIRLVKNYNAQKGAILIDMDASYLRKVMESLNPGTGGYTVLVTSDGQEFYGQEDNIPDSTMIYDTGFYKEALSTEDETFSTMTEINGKKYLFLSSRIPEKDALLCALVPEENIMAEAAQIRTLTVILSICFAVVALILGVMIAQNMSGTIHYILRKLRKVADGDLTIHLTTRKQDEFGLLCEGINHTVEHVKELIVHVNEVSNQLNEAAGYVNEASGTFLKTSQNIQEAVECIETGVNKLDNGAENCLTQMDALSGKIADVSLHAQEISNLTSSAGTTIESGIQSVQGLTSSAESTVEITRSVLDAIEELEERSRAINEIVAAINQIAEQTNLLSLNAFIEAARAQEAGKGFAVVAEEIRKLSDQCLVSAGQISDIVAEIVAKTGEVAEIARKAEEIVSTQSGAVEETTQSFRQIDTQVASLLIALDTISNNVSEMDSSRSETLEAIEGISEVSGETAECSVKVYESADSQLGAVKELKEASVNLRERASRLIETLGKFIV